MNRTALAVVALAVGAILIIVLFNIYKPEIDSLASDVFSKVGGALDATNLSNNAILPTLRANLAGLL